MNVSNGVKKIALLASYEKDDHVLNLGKLLKENGWDILGSAGTAKYLNENGIEARDVGEIVGPPILGHRVVTLSREIHAALLASTSQDFEELKRLGVQPINLVYVTLYPLEQAVKNGKTPSEIIEKTDIGGPTLLRAAAKGRRLVLSNPSQIDEVAPFLDNESEAKERLVTKLVAAAERRVAEYVGASADYWERKTNEP